jgi:hypothetical protein
MFPAVQALSATALTVRAATIDILLRMCVSPLTVQPDTTVPDMMVDYKRNFLC